jgi:hypothetical protein
MQQFVISSYHSSRNKRLIAERLRCSFMSTTSIPGRYQRSHVARSLRVGALLVLVAVGALGVPDGQEPGARGSMEKIPGAYYVPAIPAINDPIMSRSAPARLGQRCLARDAGRCQRVSDGLSGSHSKPNEPRTTQHSVRDDSMENDRARAAAHLAGTPGLQGPSARWTPNEPGPRSTQLGPAAVEALERARA